MGDIIAGLLLLVTVGLLAIRHARIARSDRPPDDTEPAPDEPGERAPVEPVPA